MITDGALRLSTNQSAAASANGVTDNHIDILAGANFVAGETLYAVISITETFTQTGIENPIIEWVFYQSELATKADSATTNQIGRSSLFSCNVGASASVQGNLNKGNKINVTLSPLTMPRTEYGTLSGQNPSGRSFALGADAGPARYIYGGYVVSGGVQFLTGKFTIDISLHPQYGADTSNPAANAASAQSHIPVYRSGFTVK